MLPALPQIASDLGVVNPNDRQLVISVILLGSAFGQLFFGPLSDKTGRKPAIFAGFVTYMAGSLVSLFSMTFPLMLAGRILQGIGLSAPRAVALALVRDRYEGRKMARIMSFSMMVFILVPMIAPTLGQAILMFAGWRNIFASFVIFAVIIMIWFGVRIPETLAPEKRIHFSLKQIADSYLEILHNRPSLLYTLTAGLIYGYFLGYINSSQQILQEQYGLGEAFPRYFAMIALSMGLAYLFNSQLVMRYGMIALVRTSSRIIFGLAAAFSGISIVFAGHPPFWTFMAFLMVSFFCTGMIFGNINALAMQPISRLAGAGAAVVGSLSTLISMLLGMTIGRIYNGTILPLVFSMVILSGASIFLIQWASRIKLSDSQPQPRL